MRDKTARLVQDKRMQVIKEDEAIRQSSGCADLDDAKRAGGGNAGRSSHAVIPFAPGIVFKNMD